MSSSVILYLLFYLISFSKAEIYIYVSCVCMHVSVKVTGQFSSFHVGSGGQTLAIRLGSKHLYPLSYLSSHTYLRWGLSLNLELTDSAGQWVSKALPVSVSQHWGTDMNTRLSLHRCRASKLGSSCFHSKDFNDQAISLVRVNATVYLQCLRYLYGELSGGCSG